MLSCESVYLVTVKLGTYCEVKLADMPLSQEMEDRKETLFVVRDIDYVNTFGIYAPGHTIQYEFKFLTEGVCNLDIAISLEQLYFDKENQKVKLRKIRQVQGRSISNYDLLNLRVPDDLPDGFYLYLFTAPDGYQVGNSIIIDDKSKASRIAIIRPVFTEWGYHYHGFYTNECRSKVDKLLTRLEGFSFPSNMLLQLFRRIAQSLCWKNVNYPYKFPACSYVVLSDFYQQNHRWDKTIWDIEYGKIDGIWCDDVVSSFAIYGLLSKNGVDFDVYSDVDMHVANPVLNNYDVIIFYGAELMTLQYYQYLKILIENYGKAVILWGVQGFGYRQVDYDVKTHMLTYKCTRGKIGMWGDKLESIEPSWSNEGDLFGFQFPEPHSRNWRKYYSTLNINIPNHWLVKKALSSGKLKFEYYINVDGRRVKGLTGAGGEILKKFSKDAQVIAYLDEDQDVIGIGEKGTTLVFSPTYWPAFFVYQAKEHPEIEALFLAALYHYLT